MGILVPIVLFVVIGWIIKILSDNNVKRLMITQGKLDENAKYLYIDKLERYVPTSLKWGMVMIALGLAIFIGKIVDAMNITGFGRNDEEALIFSLMFIFGGTALIIYYVIASKMAKKAEEEDNAK